MTFLSWAAEPEMEERKLVIAYLIALCNDIKEERTHLIIP